MNVQRIMYVHIYISCMYHIMYVHETYHGLRTFSFIASTPGTDVMIIKLFSQFFCKKLAFLTQSKGKLCKILIITSVFEKKSQNFRRKLSKIAENRDHNIGPRSFSRMSKVVNDNYIWTAPSK
jgi:hypothetical protein